MTAPASSLPAGLRARPLRETDHLRVVEAVGQWWGTPNAPELSLLLPRLFFQHFTTWSEVVEAPEDESLVAFLIAFRSSSQPEIAYIHFVGVDPAHRGQGIAAALYERLFQIARAAGCRWVDAVTSPVNRGSQAFHAALGFEASGTRIIEGVLAHPDYDSPGQARVALRRAL